MQAFKYFVILMIMCVFLAKCENRDNAQVEKASSEMSDIDSFSKQVLQTFALPYNERMKFDSSSLVFYCLKSYDTSSLIEIKKQKDVIRVAYYEILPNYHRFETDYADKNSKLIFFEGYSFTIDSIIWKSIIEQAKIVFDSKEHHDGKKYTDGAVYALYYNSESKHGDSNNEEPFERFNYFLRLQFIDKYIQLRKPIMYKSK